MYVCIPFRRDSGPVWVHVGCADFVLYCVCMYECTYIYIYIYIYILQTRYIVDETTSESFIISLNHQLGVYVCVHACMYVCVCVRMYVCVYIYMYMKNLPGFCNFIFECARIYSFHFIMNSYYVCTCVCVCMYVCVYAYIHIHIHTYIPHQVGKINIYL